MLTLDKGLKKANKESDPITLYNQLIGNIDKNIRKIEKDFNKIDIIQLILYTTTNRPDPTKIPVGSMFFNTTTGIPNFSNGVNWVNAAGVIV